VDTRDDAEQAELRRSARRLARDLGPTQVGDLDDTRRVRRLAAAVRDAGWLELRDESGAGGPLAGGVEAGIIAEALGAAVADVAYTGPLLAADLARRAGAAPGECAAVGFAADLRSVAVVAPGAPIGDLCAVDVDPARATHAYVLVSDADAHRLATVPLAGGARSETDLARRIAPVDAGAAPTVVADAARALDGHDISAWTALGLALTSADLVGLMRGVLDVTVAYATERRQYGVPVGSFQAVQHLLAEARCLLEGSHSAALHASWAVDALDPADALLAGRVAKAYCARAARTVCETAVQVHGGIGNTWECVVHMFLRRALLSSQLLGDDATQCAEIARTRLGTGRVAGSVQ
jgi:alkylation response protein AidB-like acyl-CoA dehydrogenase